MTTTAAPEQERQTRMPSQPNPSPEAVCLYCGRHYPVGRGWGVFCSKMCGMKDVNA